MHVPIVRKTTKRNDVYIERALPKKGQLDAPLGTKVEPFTKLGMSKVSYGSLPIGSSLRISKGKDVGTYFYTGDVIGKLGKSKVIAPFDGYLEKIPNGYRYRQEERDFWLLPGVWGEIVDVVDNYSVLLKTQTVDLSFAACTKGSYEGELIVFPNPSELLEMQYLEKFSKDSFGKIIYMGEYLDSEVVIKAAELGVAGLFAGSCDRKAFPLAKKHNIFLGVLSGFGHIPTPDYIFNFLKEVSNRFVFLQGERGIVRIPVHKPFDAKQIKASSLSGQVRRLKKGLRVQVFDEPHFGWVGTVDRIQKGKVYVMLDDVQDPVVVEVPNIISLE